MAWLSRTDFSSSDFLSAAILNNLGNDIRYWGGNVDAGGNRLSNVILEGSGGFTSTLSPINLTQGPDGETRLELRTTGAGGLLRWVLAKDSAAESGSNAGSNFVLRRYQDSGVLLDTPFAVNRASGLITMGAQKWAGPVDGGGQTISNIVISGTLADPTTTKGDLLVRSAAAVTRLGVGADGSVLTTDATQALGVKWAPPVNAILSVFSRTGVIAATAGDYTAAQVTNAVSTLGAYADPAWLTSVAWTKITGAPAAGVSSVFTRTGAVVAAVGDYTAAQVTNALSSIGAYADPAWLTSLSWGKITGAPAAGVSSVFTRTGAVSAAFGDYTAAQVTNAVSTVVPYPDPSWITSLSWAKILNPPATGVSSVFTRVGAIVAASGDYTAAQVTNAVSTIGTYADPAWLTSLAWTKITGRPTTLDATYFINGTAVGSRPNFNLIAGSNTILSGQLDTSGPNRVDVTITAVGVNGGQPQSPWASNILGAGFQLQNAGMIGIANDCTVLPVAGAGPYLMVGGPASSAISRVAIGFNAATPQSVGSVSFTNWAITGAEKRISQVAGFTEAIDAGGLLFHTMIGGALVERMRISGAGFVGIGLTPTTFPLEVAGDTNVTGAYRVNGQVVASVNATTTDIAFVINDGGSVLATGVKGDLVIDFACTITGWTLLADTAGSVTVNVWKIGYASYPPTASNSIVGATPPTITGTIKAQGGVGGWTTAIVAGDTLRFNVDSCSGIARVSLILKVTKN